MRLAMYLTIVTLALAVLVQGWSTLQLEQVRAVDADILDKAGYQSMVSQQIARRAALINTDPTQRVDHTRVLSSLLQRSGQEALALENLLARQMQRSPDAAGSVAPALDAWQAARERLWSRAGTLLRHADAHNDSARASSSSSSDGDVRHAAAAVQAEADATLSRAQSLSEILHSAAQRRSERVQGALKIWVAGLLVLLLLLALLALVVVEPTARAARRQFARMAEQGAELRRLALVAESTQALVIITDGHNRVQWANAAFTRLTGWPLAEALGRTPFEMLGSQPADAAALACIHDAVAQGRPERQLLLAHTRAGQDIWLDVDLQPLHDDAGRVVGSIRVSADVTARVVQQHKLEALWAALPAGVMVRCETGQIVDANRAAERLLGLSLVQMQERDPQHPCWRAIHEDGSEYADTEHPSMRTLRSGKALQNQTLGIRTPQGELRWLLVNTEPQLDRLGHTIGVVSCFSDITERRALQEQLHAAARTDSLTQLPNRAVVMERLQRAIEHAQRNPGYGFAVLFMDFDRFKQVNDTLGHGAGDELLRQIAQRLRLALRPGDAVARVESELHVAARMGGDEFVVVLEGVREAQTAQAVAERLLADLAEPYNVGANPVHSSASIGVVLWQGQATTAEEILRNADTAMYEAKRAGRGRYVMFDHSMQQRVVHTLAVENDLRRALKDDELFVVYQPVMELSSQRLVAVEALVRWHHPQRGLVMPAEFIGIAEECGLIDAVGSVVLHKACTQFMQWQRDLGRTAPRQLAVNLSRAQLKRADLVADVAQLLAGCGMRAEQLQLEITESLAAQDERVQTTLRELKGLGVKLALDDFGTGYSSLACLHQLPIDTVKIDRSFVGHAQTLEYHRVLIEATVRVARALGISTVAEGIETESQAELMRQLNCDLGQGYLYSKPMEAAEMARWAQREHLALTEG